MQAVPRRGFWLSYLGFLILFIFLTAFSSNLWRTIAELPVVGIALLVLFAGGWLIWRGWVRQAAMPRTNLEWVIAACILAALLSLIYSPNPQPGLWRVGWFIGYAVLFYALLDVFDAGVNRWGAVAALMTLSGFIMLLALNETFLWYQEWWRQTSGLEVIPPVQYRFTSILAGPGPTMALANLCFPLVVLALRIFKYAIVRVLCLYWLIIFLLTLPFSSSRGGWLGLAVTVVAGLGLLIWEKKLWRVPLVWQRKKQVWVAATTVVGLVVLMAGIYIFMSVFASHPTHGGNPFGSSGRGDIWRNAIDIWKTSPLIGVGPGRFGVSYQATLGGSPPAWWAGHAHSIFFQALAEFGLVGLAALIGWLLAGFWSAWNTFRRSPAASRAWSGVLLTALMGFAAQLVFDEHSGSPMLMSGMVMVAALLGSGEPGALKRFPQMRVAWGAVPLAVVLGAAAWGAYTYQPMSSWQEPTKAERGWAEAARLIHTSASRDPSNMLYAGAEGLAWATDWGERGDPLSLEQARAALRRSLAIEPGYSILWADLAVLDWHAGAYDAAFSDIERAIQIAPKEYAYQLNRAWFLEQRGDVAGAIAGYVKALTLSPERANHPFWGTSAIRQQAIQQWKKNAPVLPEIESYWQDAVQDMAQGDWMAARLNLARSWVMQEPYLPRLIAEGKLLDATGQPEEAIKKYLDMIKIITPPEPFFNFGPLSVGAFSVPGVLHLEPDWGQFAVLERVAEVYRSRGECEQAVKFLWVVERMRSGGAVMKFESLLCP